MASLDTNWVRRPPRKARLVTLRIAVRLRCSRADMPYVDEIQTVLRLRRNLGARALRTIRARTIVVPDSGNSKFRG